MGAAFSFRREDPAPDAASDNEHSELDSSQNAISDNKDDTETQTDQESQQAGSSTPHRSSSVASDSRSSSEEEEAHVARILAFDDPEGNDDGKNDDQGTEADVENQQVIKEEEEEKGEEEDHVHIDDWNVDANFDDKYVTWRNRLFDAYSPE